MNTRRFGLFAVLLMVIAFAAIVFEVRYFRGRKPRPPQATSELVSLGRGLQLYQTECAMCHGSEGRGDGVAAYLMNPRPRDLASGVFKVRSTGLGDLPTDDDLMKIVTNGMPGSAMPAFDHLLESDRLALVEAVKSFNPAFKKRQPTFGMLPPSPPKHSPEGIARGKLAFLSAGCSVCHGTKGDLVDATTAILTDNKGMPIRPNTFTRGVFKGGSRDEDLYLRMMTGIQGTPMIGYRRLFSDEQAYDVVQYIKSLKTGDAVSKQPSQTTITATRINDAVPEDPRVAVWASTTESVLSTLRLALPLKGAPQLRVKAVYNSEDIAIR
ncbi:MAG: c-type cytochrome, partial [Candidatus Poribacteria bacterium]|nr:c-type cytochrome [Candidatus Poribacteria bacterium]